MIKYIFLIINFLFSFYIGINAQSFDNWLTGSTNDVSTNHLKGLVLAGGGSDNDEAMTWMLNRADGGDVVILRTSGTDGYNDYFFNQLGVTLNSVETIRINNASGANDTYVLEKVSKAEVIFIAGGDQTSYYDYWQGSLLQDTLNYLINTKEITIGGTSAGMMILSQYHYIPQDLGVLSSEALSNPFHQYMDTIHRNEFLQHPLMESTINDSHFDNDDRAGRMTTFMARMVVEDEINARGIAANEVTAICIDENGIAHVFGEYPNYDDYAYFVQTDCDYPLSEPENCTPGTPLTWNQNSTALKVYRVPGTISGNNTFDLNTWKNGTGGDWRHWYVNNGMLNQEAGNDDFCVTLGSKTEEKFHLSIYPNPASDKIRIQGELNDSYSIYNSKGQLMHSGNESTITIANWESGLYTLHFSHKGISKHINWIKE